MADNEPDTSDPRHMANITFAYLQRIENQLGKVMEVLVRHDTRLGRIERDVGEVKGDVVLLEKRVLNATNEILKIVERVDGHQRQLEIPAAHP
jgi:hypothetical protein